MLTVLFPRAHVRFVSPPVLGSVRNGHDLGACGTDYVDATDGPTTLTYREAKPMKPVTRVWNRARGYAMLFALTLGSGCADKIVEPALRDCEKNNTAILQFENKSTTNSTYDIIFDGSRIFTLSPGAKSAEHVVAAGIQHTLLFKYANTNNAACSPSTPTEAMCTHFVYSCTG